jgi:predicted ATPase
LISSYTFSNFRSFKDEVKIDFSVNRHVPENHMTTTSEAGERLSKAIAIIGPNGSGKTNILGPIGFLTWFISDSFRSDPKSEIAVQSHFFSDNAVSNFSMEFDDSGKRWRYTLSLTPQKVIAEALFVKTSRLYSFVFAREWDEANGNYKVKQNNFGLAPREAAKVRENASLISTAAQYDVPLARRLADVSFASNVDYGGRQPSNHTDLFLAADIFRKNPPAREKMNHLLRNWDLGLSDVLIEEVDVKLDSGEMQRVPVPFGIHKNSGKVARLVLSNESSGTQSAFLLLSKLLPILAKGGLAAIDEFEADLHPHMLAPILDLFFTPESNPHNAQLIFTCHSMEVLNLLHKSQIYLVEKGDDCISDAWRLDSIQGIRSDENLYAKYMAGAYAAVPNL